MKALGEFQAEPRKQGCLRALGAHHAADAQLTAGLFGQWQDHIGALDAAQLLQDGAGTVAQAGAGLPLLQGLPQHVGQEADQDVRLNPALLLMPDGTDGKIALVNAEGSFSLGELDLCFPELAIAPVVNV